MLQRQGDIQFFDEPSMNELKTSDGNLMKKSDEKHLTNKFQLKTYLYNVVYPNMGNLIPLTFHIWKYLSLYPISKNQKIDYSELPNLQLDA